MTSSRVRTRIKVHAAARATSYVANELHNVMMLVTEYHDLEPDYFYRNWTIIENGLRSWISRRSLRKVVLEVFDPGTNGLVRRFAASLDYREDWAAEDERFDSQIERLKDELAGLPRLDGPCRYRLVVDLERDAPNVPGWQATQLRDASHLHKQALGTIIDTNAIGAAMDYWI